MTNRIETGAFANFQNNADAFPLSFAQQRLWFLQRLDPESSTYNTPRRFRLRGKLNVRALQWSFDNLIQRHEVLRTTFAIRDGEAVQIVHPAAPASVSMTDLRDNDVSQREETLGRLLHEDAGQPFDLDRGPLLRVGVVRLTDDEHVLLLNMHHVISDGWSMGVLFREISALYRSHLAGKPCLLPDLPVQYADYAIWQRDGLGGEELDRQLSYWKQQLDGAPRVLALPTDYPRPATLTHTGSSEQLFLSTELSEKVRSLSRVENTTVFMTLLAAFGVLMHRLAGEAEVVIGTPIAGRSRAEIEGLIGCFLNHLALRIDLSAKPSFTNLLAQVREIALSAYTYQDVPFERLLEELRPERNLSHTPIFQAYINMLDLDNVKIDLPGVTSETIELSETESKFDLTLYIRDDKKNLHFNLVYSSSLFAPPRMAEMLRQMESILAQAVDDPTLAITRLSLVTEESAKILPNPRLSLNHDWHGAIHERLTLRAINRPEALALVDPWGQWDYRTLDLNSNRVAHFLRAGGIQREDIVAVYGHRSASLVCAIFGILKAGAAFLILDPANPDSRLLDCVDQAQPQAWLQLEAAGRLPDGLRMFRDALPSTRKLVVPRTSATLSNELREYSIEIPSVQIEPDGLAYISFTSGSSGRPKGVLGRHGPLTHFLPWQERAFDIECTDRFSMLSGLSHDPLQRDIFTAVWVGASIHIPDSDLIGTSKLASWMAEEAVSFAHLTPPMLKLLVDTAGPGQLMTSLRYAFMVGDSFTSSHVKQLRGLAPRATCIASYGTTETQRAVGYEIAANVAEFPDRPSKPEYPLGTGMEDVQLLVLNSEKQLAGVGEYGEIYFRSPHLARGYLNDASLTATKFLVNPHTNDQQDRLYKTGDMGRYLPDGKVEFAGRVDHQIKIRGYRIELGEIEAVLGQHDAIQQAVVLAREDNPGDRRLVGYVVARSEASFDALDVRKYLKQKLPEYMIPSALVPLDALPLTPNGKVDRGALPAPDRDRRELAQVYRGPRTPSEATLTAIWREVLKLAKVGIHDNFFDLGGHSLLATQVVSRIRSAFSIEFPLRSLFEMPTVAEMAEMIEQKITMRVSDPELELAQMLREVEAMTEEEAEKIVAK